jgi:hypothetical protein
MYFGSHDEEEDVKRNTPMNFFFFLVSIHTILMVFYYL